MRSRTGPLILAAVALGLLIASVTILPWQTKMDVDQRQDLSLVADYISYNESDGSEVAAGTYDYVSWGVYVAAGTVVVMTAIAIAGWLRRTAITVALLAAVHHGVWAWKIAEVFHGGLAIGAYTFGVALVLFAVAAGLSPSHR